MEDLNQQKSCENNNENIHNEVAYITASAQSLSIQKRVSYKCIICVIDFDDHSDYIAHLISDEHEIMALVTGIGFYEPDPENTNEFPTLYYCVMCNVFRFDYTTYETHLKSIVHKDLAKLMRMTSFGKETIIVGIQYKHKAPISIPDFESLKRAPNYCQLCDVECNAPMTLEAHKQSQRHIKLANSVKTCEFCNITYACFDAYRRHLITDLHFLVKDFKTKLLITETERMKTPKKLNCFASFAEATPLPTLYFCKLCNIEFNDVDSFRRHRNISTHRRIEKLIGRMSIKKKENDALDVIVEIVDLGNKLFRNELHYCELCKVWCSNVTETFEIHVQGGIHLLNRSAHIVQNWACSPDKIPDSDK